MTRLFQITAHVAVLEQHRIVGELDALAGYQTGGKAKISAGVLKEIMNSQ